MNQAHAAATSSGPANRSGRRHQAPRPARAVEPPMSVTARTTWRGSTHLVLDESCRQQRAPKQRLHREQPDEDRRGPRGDPQPPRPERPGTLRDGDRSDARRRARARAPSTTGSDARLSPTRPAGSSSIGHRRAAACRSPRPTGRPSAGSPSTGARTRRSPKSVALRLDVRITAGGRGSAAISSATSIPSRPGRTTSSTTTSAGSSRSRSSAWAPLVASPTTSNPSASSSWRA